MKNGKGKSRSVKVLIMDVDETIIRTKEYEDAGKPRHIAPFINPVAIDLMQMMQRDGYKIILITHGSTPKRNIQTGGIIPGHYELLDKLEPHLKEHKIRVAATTQTADIAADRRVFFPVIQSRESGKDQKIYDTNVSRIIRNYGKGSRNDFLWQLAKDKAGIKPFMPVEKVLVVGDNFYEVAQAYVAKKKYKYDAGAILLNGGTDNPSLQQQLHDKHADVKSLGATFQNTPLQAWSSRRHGAKVWSSITDRLKTTDFTKNKTSPASTKFSLRRSDSWPSIDSDKAHHDWHHRIQKEKNKIGEKLGV